MQPFSEKRQGQPARGEDGLADRPENRPTYGSRGSFPKCENAKSVPKVGPLGFSRASPKLAEEGHRKRRLTCSPSEGRKISAGPGSSMSHTAKAITWS